MDSSGFITSILRLNASSDNVQSFKQGVAALVTAWTVWRLSKALSSKNPLNNVPGPKSESVLVGNMAQLFNSEAWDYHSQICKDFPTIAKIPMGLGNHLLYVKDAEAMYHILVKDQKAFEEPVDVLRVNYLLLGSGLLGVTGERHRRQRKLLNPVFSIAHMRKMIPTFYEVIRRLVNSFKLAAERGEAEIDISPWMTRTALELIGQSGLGSEFDSLAPDAVIHPYSLAIKKLMGALATFGISRFLVLPLVGDIGSPRFRRWVVDMLPWKKLHKLRDMVDVLHNTSKEILESKKRALNASDEVLQEQVGEAKDLMSILLKANMTANAVDRMPDDELIGSIATMTFAATDTTSNALCRILDLLSQHQEVQDRLRQEILEAKNKNGRDDLSYDELVQLPYLDAICRETLRLFPPVPIMAREAVEDIVLPVGRPYRTTEGKEAQEVHVPKKTFIVVSVSGINTDPFLWGPDAEKWRPERWLSPLPDNLLNTRHPGIYSHLMTFAGGSRACIGFKFSQLEMKVALCLLLESLRFSPSGKKIYWEYNVVAQPSVEDASCATGRRLGLPLKVSLA